MSSTRLPWWSISSWFLNHQGRRFVVPGAKRHARHYLNVVRYPGGLRVKWGPHRHPLSNNKRLKIFLPLQVPILAGNDTVRKCQLAHALVAAHYLGHRVAVKGTSWVV